MDAFATAYAALKAGNRARADLFARELDARGARAATDDFYSANATVPAILSRQMRALFMLEDGKRTEGLALLREAAAMEDAIPLEFGPPDVVKPTHELLGEVLLAFGQGADAQRAFAKALSLAPGRPRSLLGLARASRAAGDQAATERVLEALRRAWHSADEELRTLAASVNRE